MSILRRRRDRRNLHAWIYIVIVGALLSVGFFILGRYRLANTEFVLHR